VRLVTSERMAGFDAVSRGVFTQDSHVGLFRTIRRPWGPAFERECAGNNPLSSFYAPDDNLFTASLLEAMSGRWPMFGELTHHFTFTFPELDRGLRHYDVSNGANSITSGFFNGE